MSKAGGKINVSTHSLQQQKISKGVESLCTRLRRQNSKIYNEFIKLARQLRKPSQAEDFINRAILLLGDNNEYLNDLNKLLTTEARSQLPQFNTESNNFEEKMKQMCELIKVKDNRKLQQFISLIEKVKDDSDINSLLFQSQKLFADEPEIIKEIQLNVVPVIYQQEQQQPERIPRKSSLNINDRISNKQNKNVSALHQIGQPVYQIKPTTKRQKDKLTHQQQKDNPVNLEAAPQVSFQQIGSNTVQQILPSGYNRDFRSDSMLFLTIPLTLNETEQKFFYKIIHLYYESIINKEEVLEFGKSIFCGKDNEQLNFEMFKVQMENAEIFRLKGNHNIFKPLNDLESIRDQRVPFSFSYCPVPISYPSVCSQEDGICKQALNRKIVSVPCGSEHNSNFIVMRKNQFEEALFKKEDEMYDVDYGAMHFKIALKYLKQVQQLNPNNLAAAKLLVDKALKSQIIQQLYKKGSQEQKELIELLQNNPFESVEVVLARLQEKVNEIYTNRNNTSLKGWIKTAEENFHKSLDHRSFYFKKNDKTYIQIMRFEKEAEFRYKKLAGREIPLNKYEKYEFENDITKYFQIQNSFQGLTNSIKCNHKLQEKEVQKQIKFESITDKKKLPIMVFTFENKTICEDTLSLILFFAQTYGQNQNEKEKLKKMAQIIFKGFFNWDHHQLDVSDQVESDEQIIIDCYEIENKIFEKNYSWKTFQLYNQLMQQIKERQQKKEEENKSALNNIENDPNNNNINNTNNNFHNGNNNNLLQVPNNNINGIEDSNGNGIQLDENEDIDEEDKQQQNVGQPKVNQKNVKLNKKQQLRKFSENNDQSSSDEEKKIKKTIRQMTFLEEKIYSSDFIPKEKQNDKQYQIFYGTSKLAIIIRMVYTLYERIYKAQEISSLFIENEKTNKISKKEKDALSKQRYQLFKNILIQGLKQKNADKQERIEDFLRSVYGNHAYLFFTIEKYLRDICKTLVQMHYDELSRNIIQEFVDYDTMKRLPAKQREQVYLGRVTNLALIHVSSQNSHERNLFRFYHDKQTNLLYMTYIETGYKYWETNPLNSISTYYYNFCNQYVNESIYQNIMYGSTNKVYLDKNKKKNIEKKYFQQNNLEFQCIPNSTVLTTVSANSNKEDVLISENKLKRKKKYLLDVVHREIKKICKFNDWTEQKLQESLSTSSK